MIFIHIIKILVSKLRAHQMRYTDYKFRLVQVDFYLFSISIWPSWIFILHFLPVSTSQVGKVNSDPDPPVGHPPHGLYLCHRRVHTLNYQSASHQALHRSLLLFFSGSTFFFLNKQTAWHSGSYLCLHWLFGLDCEGVTLFGVTWAVPKLVI